MISQSYIRFIAHSVGPAQINYCIKLYQNLASGFKVPDNFIIEKKH